MARDLKAARVLVIGGTGFLGQYVCHEVEAAGGEAISVSRRRGYDLRNEADALSVLLLSKPDVVVHLAGTVGGIGANAAAPATFFRDNMLMGMNVVHAAALARTRLIMVGSVCSYPKDAVPPFKEEALWNGHPEETNAPYGIAKRALLAMCRAYRKQHGLSFGYVIPANLYGPGDRFGESGHVIPALIRRFFEGKDKGLKEVVCWGTGKPTRSFLFVHDAAKAIALAAASLDDDDPVNLPGSSEISIADLAALVAKLCGYAGKITWDPSKPDGQPRRALDGARAEKLLGWKPKISLEDGLRAMIDLCLSGPPVAEGPG